MEKLRTFYRLEMVSFEVNSVSDEFEKPSYI